jgi:hypothetical protein
LPCRRCSTPSRSADRCRSFLGRRSAASPYVAVVGKRHALRPCACRGQRGRRETRRCCRSCLRPDVECDDVSTRDRRRPDPGWTKCEGLRRRGARASVTVNVSGYVPAVPGPGGPEVCPLPPPPGERHAGRQRPGDSQGARSGAAVVVTGNAPAAPVVKLVRFALVKRSGPPPPNEPTNTPPVNDGSKA